MTDDQLNAALQAEYLQLQKTIEDFDARTLTIKAWSVTFSLAALGGAFVSHVPAALLVASGSAFLFWMLEATWKQFQYAYYKRSGIIEKHFRGELKATAALQIGTAWAEAWNGRPRGQLLRIALWPHVVVPHGVTILVALALFVLVKVSVLRL